MMEYGFYKQTKLGQVGIFCDEVGITKVVFQKQKLDPNIVIQETPLIKKAFIELEEYLLGLRTEFQLPLHPRGTVFQKKVWKLLTEIPYGKIECYSSIAAKLGNKNAARAVGMANHCNPIPIFIPCHRVVGKSGNLTGYALGLKLKEKLLALERENIT